MTNYARDLSEPRCWDCAESQKYYRRANKIGRGKEMSTNVELNGASNIVTAARQLRVAVNQGNISETVTIAGEIEQMANDWCMYLQALSDELREKKQSLPLSWSAVVEGEGK